MNIALWAIQGILALMFIAAGSMKAFQYEKAKTSLPWVKEYSRGYVAFIGISEVLGGIGLIVPFATGIAPVLTSIAAIALAFIMILAAVFHTKRKEYQGLVMNIILLALAVFIAIGRF